jgi:hypothetical protein
MATFFYMTTSGSEAFPSVQEKIMNQVSYSPALTLFCQSSSSEKLISQKMESYSLNVVPILTGGLFHKDMIVIALVSFFGKAGYYIKVLTLLKRGMLPREVIDNISVHRNPPTAPSKGNSINVNNHVFPPLFVIFALLWIWMSRSFNFLYVFSFPISLDSVGIHPKLAGKEFNSKSARDTLSP